MAARETAAARDAGRLEQRKRLRQRRNAGHMRAIGTCARDDFGMALHQQRRALALDDRRQRLDAVDHGAVIGRSEAHEHGRHIAGAERRGERNFEPRGIGDRRGHEINARGGAPRFDLVSSRGHGGSVAPAI